LAGAAVTTLAKSLPFIASDAAVAFIRIGVLFLKALMVSAKSLGMFLFSYRKRKTEPFLLSDAAATFC
jgi:hypothetical protein